MRPAFNGHREPPVGNGRLVPRGYDARGDPSPSTPGPKHARASGDQKLTRNTERAFLALLIADDDSKEGCQLQASLAQAERDGKCIRRAVSLMLMFFMLAAGGLGYCAILLPAVFQNPSHLLMRSLSVLGLASLISQVVFVGYLLWHRAVVIGLHKECRLLALARSQLPAPPAANLAVDVQGPPLRTNPENHPSIPGSQHA